MPWTKPYKQPSNQRLDPELYQQSGLITFITIRSHEYQRPFVSSMLNRMIIDTLLAEQDRLICSIFTCCLMPDHLHFLISPRIDGFSVLKFTDQFKGKTTNCSWKLGWKGKLWQPRSYDHVIRTDEDLNAISDYILDNPIQKGLASKTEDWLWSGFFSPLP